MENDHVDENVYLSVLHYGLYNSSPPISIINEHKDMTGLLDMRL